MEKHTIKPGQQRFDYFLASCEALLIKAATQKNPGLWLYQHDFRTPLFMLEGLSKLYADLHNRKKFTKLKERFKFLEDILGGADYYDCFAKEFAAGKKVPKPAIAYLQAQQKQKITALNDILTDKAWLKDNSRIRKIKVNLQDSDWLKQDKEIHLVNDYYQDQVARIIAFVQEKRFQFKDMESDVHELRRKLRWLSIYPQALRGAIQLTADKKYPKFLEKYLSKEITGSPFNKMPDAENNTCFLMLDQHRFYALSWMIAELGVIKDNGLRIFALKEAIEQTEKLDDTASLKRAYELLGKKQPPISELLAQAENITRSYFKEKNLQALVAGVAKVKS